MATATAKTSGSAKAAKPIVLTFDFAKETKGTLQFKEPDTGNGRPAVGSLYITKEALKAAGLSDAANLEVTIKVTGWDR